MTILGLIIAVAVYGFHYYRLPLMDRPGYPLHARLRPSGTIGLLLGKLGFVEFFFIYLYAIRKRWSWLKQIGNSRHWLDFHVVLGITAPLVITLHSSFKFHGLAGVAYWIMWIVTLSGIVGRYFYAQIPRSLNEAELSLQELESLRASVSRSLTEQHLLAPEAVASLFRFPSREEVREMSAATALFRMILLDVARPFQMSKLRRKSMGPLRMVVSLGGLLHFGHRDLEEVISMLHRHSWLSAKINFLDKIHRIFHLWHVIHRPFSYSLAILVLMHVATELLFGYY